MTPKCEAPPAVATWLLSRITPKPLREELLGDLAENFRLHVEQRGARYARSWYWRQIFHIDYVRLFFEARSIGLTGRSDGNVSGGMTRGLGLDLKYIFRSLRREPGFVFTAVATLSLGVGATTAVFSLVHAVLLQPLPYANPQELVLLWNRLDAIGVERAPIASVDVIDFREQSETFEGFALANSLSRGSIISGDRAWLVAHARVTPNFFTLLGVRPVVGELFRSEPSVGVAGPGATIPIVVSHEFWRRAFGGNPDVVGDLVRFNGVSATVAGVAPKGFQLTLPPEAGFPAGVDVWSPTNLDMTRGVRDNQRVRDQDSDDTGIVIARLRSDVTLRQAQAEMNIVAAWQRQSYRWHADVGARVDVVPMHSDVVGTARGALFVLSAAVATVLLIACINVANLMLTRVVRRRREFVTRVALGATNGRIARLAIMESLLIAFVGGAIGLVLARGGMNVLLTLQPSVVPLAERVALNTVVVLFALGASVSTALIFGFFPVLATISLGGRSLSVGHASSIASQGRTRVRAGLVVAEVAASMALVIVAGLLVKSFRNLQKVDPGFVAENVVSFDITLRNPDRHDGPAARTQFVRQLIAELEALPGVANASLVSRLPLDGRIWTNQYELDVGGEQRSEGDANFLMISAGYFDTMSTTLVAGRLFNRSDDDQNIRVTIVDEVMARRIAPTGDALDHIIGFPLDGEYVRAQVVGVVESIRYTDLRLESRGTIYVPYRHEASRDVSIVVRTGSDAEGLAAMVPDVVAALDVATPVYNVRPLTDMVAAARSSSRFLLVVIGVFASVALAMAVIGLYGVISYAVGLREKEIGVRMALGAPRTHVVREVVRQGMVLACIGLVIGLLMSLAAGRVVEQVLYGVRAADMPTLWLTAGVLLAVSFVACWLPAHRASKIGLTTVLRID